MSTHIGGYNDALFTCGTVGSNIVLARILNLFAEENAVEDTIYYLSESLRKEAIDLEVFLKVRSLPVMIVAIFRVTTTAQKNQRIMSQGVKGASKIFKLCISVRMI